MEFENSSEGDDSTTTPPTDEAMARPDKAVKPTGRPDIEDVASSDRTSPEDKKNLRARQFILKGIGLVMAGMLGGFGTQLASSGLEVVNNEARGHEPVLWTLDNSAFDDSAEAALAVDVGSSGPSGFSFDDASRWLSAHDGVKTAATHVEITITGNRDGTISITDVRAHAIDRKPPLSGTLVEGLLASYGLNPTVPLVIDLDRSPYSVAYRSDGGTVQQRYLRSGATINLAKGEKVTLDIIVRTQTCYCTFDLQADIADERGHKVQVTFPNNGKAPFAVTAIAHRYATVYANHGVDLVRETWPQYCGDQVPFPRNWSRNC